MEVVRALKLHLGVTESAAKDEIAMLIREGKLQISARKWKSDQKPSQPVWDEGPPDGTKRRWITNKKFLASKSWASDAKNWKWNSGKFYLTRAGGDSWLMLANVRFRLDDVRTYLDELSRERGKGGAPGKKGEWTIAWLRVAEMARNGELTAETLKGEKAFNAAFWDGLPKEDGLTLKDATLKPLNRAVRDHFGPIIEAEQRVEPK